MPDGTTVTTSYADIKYLGVRMGPGVTVAQAYEGQLQGVRACARTIRTISGFGWEEKARLFDMCAFSKLFHIARVVEPSKQVIRDIEWAARSVFAASNKDNSVYLGTALHKLQRAPSVGGVGLAPTKLRLQSMMVWWHNVMLDDGMWACQDLRLMRQALKAVGFSGAWAQPVPANAAANLPSFIQNGLTLVRQQWKKLRSSVGESPSVHVRGALWYHTAMRARTAVQGSSAFAIEDWGPVWNRWSQLVLPPRLKTTMYQMIHHSLPTMEMKLHRGWVIPAEESKCPLCPVSEDTVEGVPHWFSGRCVDAQRITQSPLWRILIGDRTVFSCVSRFSLLQQHEVATIACAVAALWKASCVARNDCTRIDALQLFSHEWKTYVSFCLSVREAGTTLPADALPKNAEAVAEAQDAWRAVHATSCKKTREQRAEHNHRTVYSYAVAQLNGKAAVAWEVSGAVGIHTRTIPSHATLNRCHLVAVLAMLEQHLAVSTDRNVEIRTSCEYTRYGCNEVASWNPASKCGGGRFSRHNDLWLAMKKLCCGDRGLNVLCTPLPLAESLSIGGVAYRTLSGTGQLPLPIGIAGRGGATKLTRQLFNNAVLTAHEHQQRWYSDAAVGERQYRIQSRAAEHGFRVGSAPGDGSCFFHSLSQLIGDSPYELRQRVQEHMRANAERYQSFVTSEDLMVNIGPDFLAVGRSGGDEQAVTSSVWDAFVTNVGANEWRVGELVVRAAASALAKGICVITDDESLSYRFTYFPLGASTGTVHLGYVDRVHYVPLIPIQRAAGSTSIVAPSVQRPSSTPMTAERREVLRKAARAQLRMVSMAQAQREALASTSSASRMPPRSEPPVSANAQLTESTPRTLGSSTDSADRDERIRRIRMLAKKYFSTASPHASLRRSRSPPTSAPSTSCSPFVALRTGSPLPKRRRFDNGNDVPLQAAQAAGDGVYHLSNGAADCVLLRAAQAAGDRMHHSNGAAEHGPSQAAQADGDGMHHLSNGAAECALLQAAQAAGDGMHHISNGAAEHAPSQAAQADGDGMHHLSNGAECVLVQAAHATGDGMHHIPNGAAEHGLPQAAQAAGDGMHHLSNGAGMDHVLPQSAHAEADRTHHLSNGAGTDNVSPHLDHAAIGGAHHTIGAAMEGVLPLPDHAVDGSNRVDVLMQLTARQLAVSGTLQSNLSGAHNTQRLHLRQPADYLEPPAKRRHFDNG
jgi:hypothetical protein